MDVGTQASEAGLRAAEQARRAAEMDAEAAEESRRDLETLVKDLKGMMFLPTNTTTTNNNNNSSANPSVFEISAERPADAGGEDNELGLDAAERTGSGLETGAGIASGSGAESGPGSTQQPPAGPAATGASMSLSSTTTGASSLLFPNINPPESTRMGVQQQQREAARRVIVLSEELQAAKQEASGLRRHVAGLREDRRHLERKLATAEAAARELEEGKAEAETRAILGAVGGGGDGSSSVDTGGGGRVSSDLQDLGGDVRRAGQARSKDVGGLFSSGDRAPAQVGKGEGSGFVGASVGAGAGLSGEEQRLLVAAALPAEVDFGGLDPEEALGRLQAAHAKVPTCAEFILSGERWGQWKE